MDDIKKLDREMIVLQVGGFSFNIQVWREIEKRWDVKRNRWHSKVTPTISAGMEAVNDSKKTVVLMAVQHLLETLEEKGE